MKEKPFLYELIETIVVVALLVIVIRGFIGEPRWIPSASMRPTIIEKDRVFVEKISLKYKLQEVKRGDILVFYPPFSKLENDLWSKFTRFIGFFDKNEAYIKRVIGVGGDTYKIETDPKTGASVVYINGKRLKEDYLYENKTLDCTENMYCGPTKIPEGYYLMLGDNRANSQDGRFWGLLPKERIIGKAVFMFWPINRIKIFKTPQY